MKLRPLCQTIVVSVIFLQWSHQGHNLVGRHLSHLQKAELRYWFNSLVRNNLMSFGHQEMRLKSFGHQDLRLMSSGCNNLSDTTSLPYRDNQHKIKLEMLGGLDKSLSQTHAKR
jgi:hypothetical protein